MKYLCLIYTSEAEEAKFKPEQLGALMHDYGAFTQAIIGSGNYIGGNPLQPTATATSVRVRDGKKVTTDGPFAETREQLGGYYLIESANLDEAVDIAARIPGAKYGTIEVRPIMVIPMPGQ
jgi:hypothetical protein